MQKIKALMEAGAYAEAARACQALLRREPKNYDVKLLLGTCRRLLGEDREFERIDEEITALPAKRRPAGWERYHALRAAALGTALVLASSVMPAATGGLSYTLYGGPNMCRTVEFVPLAEATDGKYGDYVLLRWAEVGRASSYRIRRATTPNYAKSKVIATVTKTYYKDKSVAKRPGKKYYYWVCPYNVCGMGRKNEGSYDVGYTRFSYDVVWPQYALSVGQKVPIEVFSGTSAVKPTSCTWRIVSGSKYASISKKGVLTAKKAGTVVVSVTYKGETKEKTVRIIKSFPMSKYDIACYRDSALEYSDHGSAAMFVMPLETEA